MLEKKYKGKISENYIKISTKGGKVSSKKVSNSKDTILTVLVTAYNHEETISKCLDSILEQQTVYNFEIWLLEDDSTDGTYEICKKYALENPGLIKLVHQTKNTMGYHASFIRRNVTSRYLTVLEADDWWCDNNKIQTALNLLEEKPEYITFAHDTLYVNHVDGTKKSLVHDILKQNISNPVSLEDAPYLHTSARIHRNVIPPMIRGDIIIYYSYLDSGLLYYHDKVMSVYNITGKGAWSGLNKKQQTQRFNRSQYRLNKLFNYKYDKYFSNKVSSPKKLQQYKFFFGKKFGWTVYILNERMKFLDEKN